MDMVKEGGHIAAQLAQAPVAAAGEYLTFRLGAEHYGVEILQVQEIRSYEAPTRVAGSAASVQGVIDLRGVVVPIVDLRVLIGCPAEHTASTVVVVLTLAGRVIGAVVDAVSDVVALQAEAIRPAPAISGPAGDGLLQGIGSTADRMLLLLDMPRLLASAGLFQRAG